MSFWGIRDFFEKRKNNRPISKLKRISDSGSSNWDVDHVRSNIIDAEELLHLKQIWRKLLLAWCFLGNFLLLALVVLGAAYDLARQFHSYLVAILVVSLVLSPTLVYLQYRRIRRVKVIIRKLHIIVRRTKSFNAGDLRSGGDDSSEVLAEQRRYRDELPEVISQYREEANRYRRVHNRFQSVIIMGSVLTSAVTTASVSFEQVRWVAVGISAVVGLAAGFTGYFKYRERSFNLQQTADAIEREMESVELRVGKYENKSAREAYMIFANAVETLRDEQNKRQQQLDQPVEVRQEEQVA